jgi:antitoxin VapB
MNTFATRQFKAGNSQAVRLPAEIAFAPGTKLRVTRKGNRIIVEPCEQTLDDLPALFAELGTDYHGGRPEFIDSKRKW